MDIVVLDTKNHSKSIPQFTGTDGFQYNTSHTIATFSLSRNISAVSLEDATWIDLKLKGEQKKVLDLRLK